MAVTRTNLQSSYGYPKPTSSSQETIIAKRAPTTRDGALPGTMWVNTSTSTVYVHAGLTAGANTWTTNPSGGVTAASMTVNPGNLTVTAGDIIGGGAATITGLTSTGTLNVGGATDIGGALGVTGATTLNGDLTVTGDFAITGDFDVTDTASIGLTSTNDAAAAISLLANGGTSETIFIRSAQGTAATSLNLVSTAGGITLAAGGVLDMNITGAATLDATGVSIDGTAASNFTVTGAADLTVSSTLGSVVVNAEEAANDAIQLTSVAGGLTADLGLIASITAAGAVTVDSSAAGVSIDGVTASNFTVTGAADLTLSSTLGSVVVNAEEAANDAIQLTSVAGGLTADLGLIASITAAGAVTVDSSAAGFSIDGVTASNVTVTGAGEDLTLSSVGGSVYIAADEASPLAITLDASDAAGGVDINAGTSGISLNATAGVVDINSTTGLVTMTPATDTQAAAAVTINANVGVGIFTGLGIAAAASQVFTITNSVCGVGSAILCTMANLGAADAQLAITRVVPAAGSFTVTCQNLGAAQTNGDCILTFWIVQ